MSLIPPIINSNTGVWKDVNLTLNYIFLYQKHKIIAAVGDSSAINVQWNRFMESLSSCYLAAITPQEVIYLFICLFIHLFTLPEQDKWKIQIDAGMYFFDATADFITNIRRFLFILSPCVMNVCRCHIKLCSQTFIQSWDYRENYSRWDLDFWNESTLYCKAEFRLDFWKTRLPGKSWHPFNLLKKRKKVNLLHIQDELKVSNFIGKIIWDGRIIGTLNMSP